MNLRKRRSQKKNNNVAAVAVTEEVTTNIEKLNIGEYSNRPNRDMLKDLDYLEIDVFEPFSATSFQSFENMKSSIEKVELFFNRILVLADQIKYRFSERELYLLRKNLLFNGDKSLRVKFAVRIHETDENTANFQLNTWNEFGGDYQAFYYNVRKTGNVQLTEDIHNQKVIYEIKTK